MGERSRAVGPAAGFPGEAGILPPATGNILCAEAENLPAREPRSPSAPRLNACPRSTSSSPALWIEFADPADAEQVFRCDLTWLTSSWTCIFGQGCPGIYADAPDAGCCTLGAHFADKADEKRVAGWVEQLDDSLWEKRSAGPRQERTGDPQGLGRHRRRGRAQDPGGRRRLHLPQLAPTSPAAYGCALHHLAVAEDVHFVETKPDVCWQLPLRRQFRDVERTDGTTYTEVSIGEYDRRGWGPGGHDFDWYCTGNTEAHIGVEPVYLSNARELIELMGQPAYDVLAGRCEAHLRSRSALALHPADPRCRRAVEPAALSRRRTPVSVEDSHRVRIKHASGPHRLRRRPRWTRRYHERPLGAAR